MIDVKKLYILNKEGLFDRTIEAMRDMGHTTRFVDMTYEIMNYVYANCRKKSMFGFKYNTSVSDERLKKILQYGIRRYAFLQSHILE